MPRKAKTDGRVFCKTCAHVLSAVDEQFRATLRQRCLVHKQRNVMNAIPKREKQQVATELAGIWKQEKKEDAQLNLAAFTRQIQSALS